MNSQTLLMIPLLTNVNLHLMKSWITLKKLQENCLNVSVSSTWKQMLLIVICLFLVMNLFSVNIKGSIIESSNCEKLLGIYITFHLNIIETEFFASQKLHLSRIAKYISTDKKRVLFKSIIFSQFNYCPMVWMCHDRGLNKKS